MPYGGHLTRMRISPSGKVTREQLTDLSGEFPTFNLSRTGSANRYTYLSAGTDGSAHPNAIAKVDNSTGKEAGHHLPDGQLPHEAIFAPRPGGTDEDDGWLLVAAVDGLKKVASLIVLDAKAVEADPIYVGRLRHHLPLTFHGSFTPRVAQPA
jgi:all-trans-8'-apo-beta-carotenal 15,15'-oxygenase